MTTVLEALGYRVLDCRCGIYHVRQLDQGRLVFDGLALLHLPAPIGRATEVHLFTTNGLDPSGAHCPPETFAQLYRQFAGADARRLAHAGWPHDRLPIEQFGACSHDYVEVERPAPDNWRKRIVAQMASGEVLCYN